MKLYTSDPKVAFRLTRGVNERYVDIQSKQKCDEEFTLDEFFDALMTLKSDKVPGLDGLCVEFYRKFWKQLGPHMVDLNMFQHSYDIRILPESVHQGLISLLPKKQKDMRYIKNLCPLTLLNDYKILAKALDNRLCEILPEIVKNDQMGFVKGCKISHNVRKSLI